MHITDLRSLGSSKGGRAPKHWTRASATSSSKVDIRLVMPHKRLLELRTLNRAIEVYSTQLMPVSEIAVKEGLREFGATKPTQVVLWKT